MTKKQTQRTAQQWAEHIASLRGVERDNAMNDCVRAGFIPEFYADSIRVKPAQQRTPCQQQQGNAAANQVQRTPFAQSHVANAMRDSNNWTPRGYTYWSEPLMSELNTLTARIAELEAACATKDSIAALYLDRIAKLELALTAIAQQQVPIGEIGNAMAAKARAALAKAAA